MNSIYDFYALDTWLDSCDANEFAPSRLLAILSALHGNVRMVRRVRRWRVRDMYWRECFERARGGAC